MPTVSAPSCAKATEPAAPAEHPGTRVYLSLPEPAGEDLTGPDHLLDQLKVGTSAGTISDEHAILGRKGELRSLIWNPSPRPIFSQLQHAACRGMNPEVYHPDAGRPTDLDLALCDGCHARLACLGLALRAEDPEARCGWYGGLGPADRDALVASLGVDKPSLAPVTDTAARAARLRAAGWTIGSIANELRCSHRTVQRYLRKAAA